MQRWLVISAAFFAFGVSMPSMAEHPSRESPRKAHRMLYTGVEGAMPTRAHITWLRYHATKQRVQGSIDEHDSNVVYSVEEGMKNFGNRVVGVGGCSIAIANDFIAPGANGQGRENVVIIDGDVINAGRCK